MRALAYLCVTLLLGVVWIAGAEEPAEEPGEETRYAEARERLVREIRRDVSATSSYLGRAALDPKVLAAIGRVPRHRFVPEDQAAQAYENRPLAIGHGQTISQPYIVAIMTDLLDLKPGDRVLEVGTGSGYQAAILGELVESVFSLEIIKALAERSSGVLSDLGYDNVRTRHGDGYYGWPEEAPFDAIIVTAAAGHVPPPLIEQLAAPGRMMIPVGSRFMVQQLVLVRKKKSGEVSLEQILPVRFVPLTGDHD